tara:strand:- start:35 stop:790 length:756 start_codon:yes stop_codon:yes gene_type:complete
MDIVIDRNSTSFNSIYLMGGSWISIPYENIIVENENEAGVADYLSFLNNNFTIQILLSGDEIGSNDQRAIFSIVNTSKQIVLSLLREPNKDNTLVIYKNGERLGSFESSKIDWANSSNFYLISIVQDIESASLSIYIDESKLTDISGTINNSDKSSISIGSVSNSEQTIIQNFWHGYIDEFRVWDTNLTSNDISFHSNNRNKISQAPDSSYLANLRGLWDCNLDGVNFNDSTGTTIYSIDGNVKLSENGTN